jgi:hypothetical protein
MKHDDFNNQQATLDVQEETASKSNKASYSSPVLTIYGSVSKLTMTKGLTTADGNQTKTASDRSIKDNIVRIAEHSLGIGLYLFDYKPQYREQWGSGRHFGVMADEVEAEIPEAVCVHPDGYKMVDYAMLGIQRSIH